MLGFVSLEGEEDTRVLSLPREEREGVAGWKLERVLRRTRLHWHLLRLQPAAREEHMSVDVVFVTATRAD